MLGRDSHDSRRLLGRARFRGYAQWNPAASGAACPREPVRCAPSDRRERRLRATGVLVLQTLLVDGLLQIEAELLVVRHGAGRLLLQLVVAADVCDVLAGQVASVGVVQRG